MPYFTWAWGLRDLLIFAGLTGLLSPLPTVPVEPPLFVGAAGQEVHVAPRPAHTITLILAVARTPLPLLALALTYRKIIIVLTTYRVSHNIVLTT